MIARDEQRLRIVESEIDGTKAFPVDVTDTPRFLETLDQIVADLGSPQVVIHNAVVGAFGNFVQVDPAALEPNFQTNVMAFLHLARRAAPAMIQAGTGAIVATGIPLP
jgi:short-subunit dehydrogenase